MNTLLTLIACSFLWMIIGLILFASIFIGLPETKRQKIIFVCFVGPIGVIMWAIDWIISWIKQYYYE